MIRKASLTKVNLLQVAKVLKLPFWIISALNSASKACPYSGHYARLQHTPRL